MGHQRKSRFFLALIPPQESILDISRFQDQLKKLQFPVIWEKPESFHIRLAYLGKLADGEKNLMEGELSQLLKSEVPFSILPSYADYLYKKHSDSVIYLGFEDIRALKSLSAVVRKFLTRNNFSPPLRDSLFLALGRIKRQRYPHHLKQFLYAVKQVQPESMKNFQVDSIAICEDIYQEKDEAAGYYPKKIIKIGKY